MNWREHIQSDDSILLGKPAIKGTRISVEFLVSLLASGWTEEKILKNYPRLSKKDIQALFAYLQECLQDGLIFESPKVIS